MSTRSEASLYRLEVATVVPPPLRDRGDDLLILAEHFLVPLLAKRPGLMLTGEARRAFRAHAWPGNVRELEHVLETAALLADGQRPGMTRQNFSYLCKKLGLA